MWNRPIRFRTKILLALVGTVVLLVGTSLLTIRHQTTTQVREMVEGATDRSVRAFAEVERLRAEELERIAFRLSGQRAAVLMDEVAWYGVEALAAEGDLDDLAEEALYELELAGLDRGVVAYYDLDDREVLTLLDRELHSVAGGGMGPSAGEGGVLLLDGRLYWVRGYPLDLLGNPVGTLAIGFSLDDETAGSLARVLEAELCFMADGRCVAGSAGTVEPALRSAMEGAAHLQEPQRFDWDGGRWALVSQALAGGEAVGARKVLAVPLDAVLRPFDRIRSAERFAGLGALLLALILGTAISRGLTGPIRTLVQATERVRAGDYEFDVRIRTRDELSELGSAFNEMVRGLALKERYRGVLDKALSRDVAEEMLRGEIRLGGETRDVTTLFADLRGFTALTEGMESQRVIAMLNEWLEAAARAIEEEGGVVDKFMGDGLMAIFGAPVEQGDHAKRAIAAARRIGEGTRALNERRRERGERPLHVGVGLATGSVVAGNTGSATRMNYTVLGETVNLAARLCGEAGAGEILMSESTYEEAGAPAEAEAAPARKLKGLSYEVRPWKLLGMGAAVALAVLLLLPASGEAQDWIPDPPTLEELGVGYISPSGWFQLHPSGRFELEGYRPGDEEAWLVPETDPFLAGRLRLFLDAFFGERSYATVELRADRGDAPSAGSLEAKIQQAFLRVALTEGRGISLQVGKFITPIGNYPSRARTPADPFIRPPLHYDHRTALTASEVPGGQAGFLTWKDRPDEFRHRGAPVVWDTPYPTGVMLLGSRGNLTARLAVVNSAPSAEPRMWDPDPDRMDRTSTQLHLGYRLRPDLHVGASYSSGVYLEPDAVGIEQLDGPGKGYKQTLVAAEATLTRGRAALHAEVVRDRWKVPQVDENALDTSWFVEGRLRSAGGLYGALRFGAIYFGSMEGDGGGEEPWDYDISRWQLAAGYRLARNLDVRAEYLLNRIGEGPRSGGDLASIRLGWTF